MRAGRVFARTLAAILAMVAAWGGRFAWAANAPSERRVVIAITGCPDGLEPAIRRIIALEIGDLLTDASEEADRLTVVCTGDSALVEASGPGRPRQFDRDLRLSEFPADALSRALALLGVEMLAALSPAVRRRVEAGAEITKPAQSVFAPTVQSTSPPAWRVDASALWNGFVGDNGLSLWGGRGRVGRDLGQRLGLTLDLTAASGSRSVELGQVRGVLLSLAGFFGVRAGRRDLFIELALGGRFGIAHLTGEPRAGGIEGNSVSRAWGGPALSLRLWAGRGRLALVFCGESGLALLGAEGMAEGATAASVRNLWVSLALGVGIRL